MATTVNFYLSGGNLGVTKTKDDVLDYDRSVSNASVARNATQIFYNGKEYQDAFIWDDTNLTVNGETTTDIQDAYEKINALGFNSGGGSSSNTSVIPFRNDWDYSEGNTVLPPSINSFIQQIENQTTPSSVVVWEYVDPDNIVGSEVVILDGAEDEDVLILTGLAYASVVPIVEKEFVMYVGGQDGTGLLNTEIRVNTFPFVFDFVKGGDAGQFNVTNFDPTIHKISYDIHKPYMEVRYFGEFSSVFTGEGAGGDDGAFEFGGFIKITEYPAL